MIKSLHPILASTAVLLTACHEQPTQTRPETLQVVRPTSSNVSRSTSATNGATLSVLLDMGDVPPSKIYDADSVQLSVGSVTGSPGPYYYSWTVDVCWREEISTPIHCDGPWNIGRGWGLSTVRHHINSDMYWVSYVVEVGDSVAYPASGSDSHDVMAPAYFLPDPPGYEWDVCDFKPDWFPFPEDSASKTKWYARNPCTGQKKYAPDDYWLYTMSPYFDMI